MFITKKNDYTGCDPDIAAVLKIGETIECSLFGEESRTVTVIAWCCKRKLYITDECVMRSQVRPIRSKKILKDAVSLMKILVSEGWRYKHNLGAWHKTNAGGTQKVVIYWEECGHETVSGYPDNFYTYQEE